MKHLLILAAFLLAIVARADVAEVKRVMNEPATLTTGMEQRDALIHFYTLQGVAKQDRTYPNFKAKPRDLFSAAANARSTKDTKAIGSLIAVNAATIRASLSPAFKEANLLSPASDLEEALKLVESTKTIDRAAQDRFARLARVAQ